jgi:fumarate reductase flavoprotein subunit
MKTWILASLLLVPQLLAAPPTPAHVKAGVTCRDCHGEGKPAKPAPAAACMGCHGDAKAMAEATRALTVNPHDSHLGPQSCTKCHAQHQPGKVLCLECHDFDLKVK